MFVGTAADDQRPAAIAEAHLGIVSRYPLTMAAGDY